MKKKIIIGISILLIIIIAAVILHESDEDRIRGVLGTLEKELEKKGDEGLYTILSKAENISALFSDECTVTIKRPRYFANGKRKLMQDVSGALKFIKTLSISFHDITVELKENNTAATLMTATAKIPGEGSMNAIEIEMIWKKIEGEWVIDTVQELETFR